MERANKPLTLEQLRGMDGLPAYWLDDESWGIISVDDSGRWAGIPFFRGRKNGVNFEYDIESRGMEVYAQQPAHIDREKWCGTWEGEADGYADGELVFDTWKCSGCGHVEETDDPEGLPDFCPDCGRAMTDKAWEELERRVFGEAD